MPRTTSGGDGSGGEGSGDDGPGEGSTGTTQPLPCDPGFGISPDPLQTGAVGQVEFTHVDPLTYIGITLQGPSEPSVTFVDLVGSDPYTWQWAVTGLSPGVYTVSFGHGEAWVAIATCQVQVVDTGTPPDPPLPPVDDCDEGQVCGEQGPSGGTCDRCPMVDSCFDPPSPYGPDGPGAWACLDSAGCQDNGQCRIWCPGEPCDKNLHPEGCPQGVETCFVDGSITSYEEACQSCCESRFHEPTGEYACWDSSLNLCRYPGDCGSPLP